MKQIALTHANENEEIVFNSPTIFYYRHSKAHASTIIVSIGGAFCPVKETEDQIAGLLNPGGTTERASVSTRKE